MVTTGNPAEPVTADELLARARNGDAEAFCELAVQHEHRLLQQARGLCGDLEIAEDLASETLVEAWRSLARYNQSCRFSTWLFSILLHRHQNNLRRARSRPVPLAHLPVNEAAAHQQIQENVPAASLSPAEAALRAETEDRLRSAIESLPVRQRQVVLLRFFQDASLPEIADLLHCSNGTVKSRLHYALAKLREMEGELNLSDLRSNTQI